MSVVQQVLVWVEGVEAIGEGEEREVVVEDFAGGGEDEEAGAEPVFVRWGRVRVLARALLRLAGEHV